MSDHKRFLNIHVLTSHSPSCLNRDDMNMQKSAVFGGVRRVRISSQCLKRAIRHSDDGKHRLGQPSIRTRDLQQLVTKFTEALADDFPAELVSDTVALIAGKEELPDGAVADAVAPWCAAEVARLCEIVRDARAEGLDEKKLARKVNNESKSLRAAMAGAMDIALFGRMATSGLMMPVDGAMSVAHVITTHAVDADIDWFSAVDDLTIEAGETGAGHLNTQEFGSGVFYRYASLDLPQLQQNMGDAPPEKALDAAAHLTALLATVVPTGKQQTFAAYNLADLVLASFGDIPVSYANAFEQPVERDAKGGFREPSVRALEEYARKVAAGYGLGDRSGVFSIIDTELSPRMDTLADLEAWVRNGGE